MAAVQGALRSCCAPPRPSATRWLVERTAMGHRGSLQPPTAPPDGLWVPPLQKGLERVASGKVTLARDRFL